MNKEQLPRWGWLLIGLFATAIVASGINVVLTATAGFPPEYYVITSIALMAPVVIYLGIWYDDERREYWEHSRTKIAGDVSFVVIGALLGSAIVLVAIVDAGLPEWGTSVIAMIAGFVASWALFWWRNTDLYGSEDD